ncbi:MAG: hypothetical protein EA351_01380 [Gemmatimonadales bacterium]|nr:MAG: hypothetical protein EA351_01380 [Gemmatimonadales bacterium]
MGAGELRIGMREGPEGYQFANIRGAAPLDDHALAVLNGVPPEVRVFGPDGQLERTFGGPGEGPGEFSSAVALQVLPGDTIVVYDQLGGRFTRFDREGNFIRTITIENLASGVIGFLDSRTVITERATVTMVAGEPIEELQIRTPVLLERVALESGTVDSIEVFGGRERYRSVTGQDGLPQRINIVSVPFTVDGTAVVRGGRLYLTDGRRPEIRVIDADGDLETVIRFLGDPHPVRDADVDRWIEERLARASSAADRRELEAAYRDMTLPATMPPFDDMIVNERGDIWVREYDPFPGDLRTWTIVDSAVRKAGRATLPTSLEILYGDTEIVLAVVKDELDVEYLVRMQLEP